MRQITLVLNKTVAVEKHKKILGSDENIFS
jgi:hypothetical protein